MIVKNNKKIGKREFRNYKTKPLSTHDIDLTLDNIDKLISEFELDAYYISRAYSAFHNVFNTKFFCHLDNIIDNLKSIKIFMNEEKSEMVRDLDIIKVVMNKEQKLI